MEFLANYYKYLAEMFHTCLFDNGRTHRESVSAKFSGLAFRGPTEYVYKIWLSLVQRARIFIFDPPPILKGLKNRKFGFLEFFLCLCLKLYKQAEFHDAGMIGSTL